MVSPHCFLKDLSTELLLNIFGYLDFLDLCRLKQTCTRFNDIINSWDHTLLKVTTIVTNQMNPKFSTKCMHGLSALEKMRIDKNWTIGRYSEKSLLYSKKKIMPWIHMNDQFLWFSRGNEILCFERNYNGINIHKPSFSLKTERNEDIVNFQLNSNFLVCGLREGGIWLIDLCEKSTLFEVEKCHNSDVTSIDMSQRGNLIVSGSKDSILKIWKLEEDPKWNAVESHCQILQDLIWKVSLSEDTSMIAVGTSGKTNSSSIFIHDVERPAHQIIHLGSTKHPDKGICDLRWDGEQTLWSCGYNSFLKRWDIRTGNCEQCFTDPHGSGLYCMDYDYHNTIMVGTQMHGRVILWDIRQTKFVQMYFMESCKGNRYQRSSPIYSLAFDAEYLFTATDQNLNVLDFSVYTGAVKDYSFCA
ncbi:unnamed protein product [Phaedon cochleariae]|uniref:F-box domain-containing protein n=1 Tax=Phaedon cochleariae TaxID=80249 RepID=A0A9P0DW52_PHACE|nr:unnamed protein product [Phaedon cochleariae]